MWNEAKEDGEVDDTEKEAIKSVTDYISTLKTAVKVVPEMNRLIEKSLGLLKEAKKNNKTQ
jgi:hypothetical protein